MLNLGLLPQVFHDGEQADPQEFFPKTVHCDGNDDTPTASLFQGRLHSEYRCNECTHTQNHLQLPIRDSSESFKVLPLQVVSKGKNICSIDECVETF